ncbi:MAG: hypothetical protein JXQ73_18140 [Phycisphaerae bacterium]|nr:hypothetical protein [Phycisphaerae bacterium]
MLISCGGCHKKLNVDDKLVGMVGRCPVCDVVLKMPTQEQIDGRRPGDPPSEAVAIPEADGIRMLEAASRQGAGGAAPASEGETTDTGQFDTDEDGYVLAVPVEDDEDLDASDTKEILGQGYGIERADDPGEYGLADDDEVVAGSSKASKEDAHDPSQGMDEVFTGFGDEAAAGPTGPSAKPSGEKILTRCPGCKGLLGIDAEYAGKMRTCPKCMTEIQVPLQSTIVAPEARASTSAGAAMMNEVVPSALAENLSPEVDLEDYVVGGGGSSRVVASYWVILAFVVGATIGFAVGWILSGARSRPGPPKAGPAPTDVIEQAETRQAQ